MLPSLTWVFFNLFSIFSQWKLFTSHCFLWKGFVPKQSFSGFRKALSTWLCFVSLDGAGFFLQETPLYIVSLWPTDGGRGELEPEQSLRILVSLLQLGALMMALEKRMHVAVEMIAIWHCSFGQKTSTRLGNGAIHRSQNPWEKPGQSHYTCLGDGKRRGREVKCFPHSEEEVSDCTSFSRE